MVSIFSRSLGQARFLLVAALVFALLSTPFLGQASGAKGPSLEIVEAPDSVLGLSNEILIQSKSSYRYLEALVKNPAQETLFFDLVSDAGGEALLLLTAHHLEMPGTYSVQVRDLEGGSSSETITFKVYGGAQGGSSGLAVTLDPAEQSGSVGESIAVRAKLSDELGNPIEGHSLKLLSKDSWTNVDSDSFATDANGLMDFYVSRDAEGISSLSVFDTASNKNIGSPLKLAFFESDSYSMDSELVELASTGSVAEFKLSGLSAPVIMGRDSSLTVTAVDEEGFTVRDYTGEIHFSSTDTRASLPNDYAFEAQDLGEHRFSLGIRFSTPGQHTLRVTDLNNFSLEGDITINVVANPDDSVDTGDDFVTDDFQREGDFTLISPASGLYSINEIEIQGAADYGRHAVIYLNEEEAGRVEVEFDNSFTFTLADLEDGTYEIAVDIVELGPGKMEDAAIVNVIEESDSESITIDTKAPELIKIESSAEGELLPGEAVTLTILTDSEIAEGAVVFEGEIIKIKSTATPKKYEVDLIVPSSGGDFTVDVILEDELGNQTQYKDQLALKVSGAALPDGDVVTGKTVIAPVTSLTATAGDSKVMLSWETPSVTGEIAYYKVNYGPSATSLLAHAVTTDSATTWTVPQLVPGKVHYFMVEAVGQDGTVSSAGSIASATPTGEVTLSDTIPAAVLPVVTSNPPKETPDTGAPLLLLLGVSGSVVFLDRLRRLC